MIFGAWNLLVFEVGSPPLNQVSTAFMNIVCVTEARRIKQPTQIAVQS